MPVPAVARRPVAFTPARAGASIGGSAIAFQPSPAGDAPRLDVFETATPAVDTAAPTTELPARRDRPVLLYNDQCEVCRALSSWVKRTDALGREAIEERPIGDNPEALKAIDPNLDIWDVYKEIHLVMPDGTVKKGGEAVGEVLKRLPQLSWATWLLDVGVGGFKPAQLALNGAYLLLDALRPAIGCKSCGGGPVAWWARPVQWTASAVRALHGALVRTAGAVSDP